MIVVMGFSILAVIALVCIVVFVRRSSLFSSKFSYRADAGAYFLADGCLVLNYRIPQAFPLDEIAYVEFLRGHGDCLLVRVMLRNGKKSGFAFRNPAPDLGTRWQRDLERAGVRCLWI